MFRLRHTSVSRFPHRGSLSACLASRPDPPSSNPACGFPALGLPRNSRLGHSQGVAQFDRSQIHQSQMFKVFVRRPPFRSSKGPLTPSLEMSYQAKFKKTVDIPKCLAWVTIIEIIAPACQLAVHFPNHARNRHTTLPSRRQFAQLLTLSGKGFSRHKHIEVTLLPVLIQAPVETKCESQKVKGFSYSSQVHHLGLFAIDLQTHPGLQLALDPVFEPVTLVTCKDNKVVSVSHQACIGPRCRTIRFVEHPIKPVQVQIGKQGRNHPTLCKESNYAK